METLYRQWMILRMIPRRGRIIISDIHSHLEKDYNIAVSRRTIERDLPFLQDKGFPLIRDNKKPEGWYWNREVPLFDIPNMDPVTALTFKLANQYLSRMLPKGVLTTLDPYFSTADKRLKDTPESAFSRWPDKVRIMSRNLTTIPPVVDTELSEKVYTALLEERRFKAAYRTVNGKLGTYDEVNPLGMAFVDGLTYLIASINQHIDPVLLVLHRFQEVELLDKPVTFPQDFDLDACVEELLTFQIGDKLKVRLCFSNTSDIQRLKESPLAKNQKIRQLDDGKFELTATVDDTLQLRWWLSGYGSRVEVLGPKDLRQEFVELARQYAFIYGEDTVL